MGVTRTMACGQIFVGNNLYETAYHEAGHIVAASALRLELRPRGIVIYEVLPTVMDGLSCYWEDTKNRRNILRALRAGQIAQVRKFPNSDTGGCQPDIQAFTRILNARFSIDIRGDMNLKINRDVGLLLTINWHAVEAVVRAIINSPWIAVHSAEHPHASRKKHLYGFSLLPLLWAHGLRTRVRERLLLRARSAGTGSRPPKGPGQGSGF